jgi:hypothetical protein
MCFIINDALTRLLSSHSFLPFLTLGHFSLSVNHNRLTPLQCSRRFLHRLSDVPGLRATFLSTEPRAELRNRNAVIDISFAAVCRPSVTPRRDRVADAAAVKEPRPSLPALRSAFGFLVVDLSDLHR